MKILQIVPRLPPAVCGVGDYGRALAGAWWKSGAEVFFLGAGSLEDEAGISSGDESFSSRSSAGLHAQLTRMHEKERFDLVILQMSGYGYAARGAPAWLALALERWRKGEKNVRLLTMFHELFASGQITSKAFWLAPFQKWVCARLARCSDMIRSNRTGSARWLSRVAPAHEGKIPVLPVFSNLGEQPDAPKISRRPSTMAMFGYQADGTSGYWSALQNAVGALGVERVIGLGKPNLKSEDVSSLRVERRGFLSVAEISATLSEVRLGYLCYNPEFLGKSGILAAFAAHGVVPVLAPWAGALSEGIEENRHVLRAESMRAGAAHDLEWIGNNILQWYAPHNITATAADYVRQWNASGG